MRNPNRTYDFCKELATIWSEEFPDWRFGQKNVIFSFLKKKNLWNYSKNFVESKNR